MDHGYEYRLENVYLRPLQHSDIEYLRIWRNDSNNNKFLNKTPYITEEMQESWFKSYLTDMGIITFAIIEESVLHRVVGSLSLYNFEKDSVEIGKVMVGDSEAHGLKIGTNATKAATLIAFEQLKINRVYLHIFEQNIPGVKSYQNAGFKEIVKKVGVQ